MRTRWALAVTVSLLLSGCAGGKDASAPQPGASEPPPLVPPDAEYGAVEGLVYGPEVLPMTDVLIEAVGTNVSFRTDADGYYALVPLDPGPYTVRANASGYQPVERVVTIVAGLALRADFSLRDIPNPQPYVDSSFGRRGQLQCEARANATGQNTNPSCAELAPDQTGAYLPPGRDANITLLPEAGGILVELEWIGNGPVVHDKLRLSVRAGQDLTWRQVEGRSVLRIEMGPAEIADLSRVSERDYATFGGQLFFVVYPGETASGAGAGAGAAAQQDYTLYVTVFYRQPPIPNYTRTAP